MAGSCRDVAAAGQKRGDVLTIMPDGHVTSLDVVVTHPAAPTYFRRAARESGSAALRHEQDKRREWESSVGGGGGYDFVPVAVETYGRLVAEASRFLSKLGDIVAQTGALSKAKFVRSAHQRISCAVVRGNAAVYYQAMTMLVRQNGRAYSPGLSVPVDGCAD